MQIAAESVVVATDGEVDANPLLDSTFVERIRDATDTVFMRAHFTRERSWWDDLEIPMPDWPPRVWWTLTAIALAMMVLAAIAQRLPQGRYGARRSAGGPLRVGISDSWSYAHDLAARGDYVSALHALFAALVASLGRAEEVDPHPAKTVGDYERELAARRSAIAAPYRRFAQQYERALYGGRPPDQSSFDSLVALIQPLLGASRTIR